MAFTWNRHSGFTFLPNLSGNRAQASFLNNNGLVVGSSPEGCIWYGVTPPSPLMKYEGRRNTSADRINNLGQIAGTASGFGSDYKAVFYASPQSDPIRLEGFAADVNTVSSAINDVGQVLFYSPNTGFVGAGPAATYIWRGGTFEMLPNGPTISKLNGRDINENEWVVGDGVVGNSIRPFLWRRSSGTQELPLLPTYTEGRANAVNDQGCIVGRVRGPALAAVLWFQSEPIALSSLVDESCQTWNTDDEIFDINSANEIVGIGSLPGLPNRGFYGHLVQFTPIIPTAFQVTEGNLQFGSIESLQYDDGDSLFISENPMRSRSTPPVELIVEGTGAPTDQSIFQFKVKARASTPGLSQSVAFYDWTSSSYVSQGSATPVTTSKSAKYYRAKDYSRFVNASGGVRCKITYSVTGTLAARPAIMVEQAIWRAAQ